MSPEVQRQLRFLAGLPSGNTTMKKKELAEILMETGGNMLACGRLYNFKIEHIGAGVYRVSLILANP